MLSKFSNFNFVFAKTYQVFEGNKKSSFNDGYCKLVLPSFEQQLYPF
jgi:hypothetical protein